MRRLKIVLLGLFIAVVGLVLAGASAVRVNMSMPHSQSMSEQNRSARVSPRKNPQYVDLKSDHGRQTLIGGRKVLVATDNFAAHHNGAVITCDSAVRLSETRLECYGNVLINKGTTYVYGDKASYDSEANEAKVYSNIVKMVDQGAILYTYNFTFNTKTNVGSYTSGGVAFKDDNVFESDRGYYYADSKELVCVGSVEMKNNDYQMTSDSLIYNTEKNLCWFFERTNIWKEEDNEYLYADRGMYDKEHQCYIITQNGYLLTQKEEGWSDSLDYFKGREYVHLRSNAQLDNQEDKILAFGDWIEYWKEPGDALLTRNPSIISYDTSEGDSVFIRSDSMFLYTKDPVREKRLKQEADSLKRADSLRTVQQQRVGETPNLGTRPKETEEEQGKEAKEEIPSQTSEQSRSVSDKVENLNSQIKENVGIQSRGNIVPSQEENASQSVSDTSSVTGKDTLQSDSTKVDTLTAAQKKALEKKAKKEKQAEIRRIRQDSLNKKLARIAAERQRRKTAILKKFERADSIRAAKQEQRADARRHKKMLRLEKKGIRVKLVDKSLIEKADSIMDATRKDTTIFLYLDSLLLQYFPKSAADSVKSGEAKDSVYKLVLLYRNVRMFRSDSQSVCDSASMTSIDSVLHMYKEPVLWNENNQITSDIMHVHTKNSQIQRAEFEGKPMTIQQVDTAHYNQVAGKAMEALFKDNEIYRNNVNGNVQTIYFVQEDDAEDITMMAYIESADMTSYIEKREVTGLTYRGNPTYTFYPIDKIPETQPRKLQGFKWEAERRPGRDSVFYNRQIRPSQRAEKEALLKPAFPINTLMERKKAQYIKTNMWEDRIDTLSVETLEWLESVK